MPTRNRVVEDIRGKARKLAAAMIDGKHELVLTPKDIQLILLCRAVGHGTIEKITVVEGEPCVAMQTIERFDFAKDNSFLLD